MRSPQKAVCELKDVVLQSPEPACIRPRCLFAPDALPSCSALRWCVVWRFHLIVWDDEGTSVGEKQPSVVDMVDSRDIGNKAVENL